MNAEIKKDQTDLANGFAWRKSGDISYLVCEPLEKAGFANAFSSRAGGISPFPSESLNLSFREDTKENVDENRARFLRAIHQDTRPLFTAKQIHSDKGLVISSRENSKTEPECDALVASLQKVLLGIQTADCLPVLIGDPQTGVMGAIHSGWRGAMARISERTITDLMKPLGAHPERCWVALGPSACGDCYEVGADVVQAFKTQFPESISFFKDIKENGKAFLDVRAANVQALKALGVPASQIFVSSYCTIHDNDLFFSYRNEAKGGAVVVGRQISVIGRN